ncbi:MAG: putative rane protein [Polaromonas sp.]|nr:putative rane protein [Polaromonas sp.]
MSNKRFLRLSGQLGVIVASAWLLCLAALWNGQPFYYPDTRTYVRGAEMGASRVLGPAAFEPWLAEPQNTAPAPGSASPAAPSEGSKATSLSSIEEKIVLSGRSFYYGVLLYAGALTGKMWLSVVLQAVMVAYVLYVVMVRLWCLRRRHVVGMAAALSLLTPLGAYTGFLMPDVFAPLCILLTGVLALYWRELALMHRWGLAGVLLFGLTAHTSHLAVAALLLMLLLLARLLSARWRRLPWIGLVAVAGCIAAGLAAEWAFNKAVTVAVGAPPLRLPHLMGHLIDMGPGTAYLKKHCPQADYAACAFVKNYPTYWEDFLFSTNPGNGAFALADAATKRRLSAEQFRFAADVLRADPVGVVGGMGAEVLHQLVNFRVDIAHYSQETLATQYEGRLPPEIFADMQRSRAARLFPLDRWLTVTTYATVLVSLALAGLWWRRHRSAPEGAAEGQAAPRRQLSQLSQLAWIVMAGVVANAAVCAILASSLDRFQARVMWLLPFLAFSVLSMARRAPAVHAGAALKNPATPPPATSSLLGTTP